MPKQTMVEYIDSILGRAKPTMTTRDVPEPILYIGITGKARQGNPR